jgi:hypothetical protein
VIKAVIEYDPHPWNAGRPLRDRSPRGFEMATFEITVFVRDNGPLSKHIHLASGKIANDTPDCAMTSGNARRVRLADVAELAQLINGLRANKAPSLGRLKAELPDCIRVVDARKEDRSPGAIARTKKQPRLP